MRYYRIKKYRNVIEGQKSLYIKDVHKLIQSSDIENDKTFNQTFKC